MVRVTRVPQPRAKHISRLHAFITVSCFLLLSARAKGFVNRIARIEIAVAATSLGAKINLHPSQKFEKLKLFNEGVLQQRVDESFGTPDA